MSVVGQSEEKDVEAAKSVTVVPVFEKKPVNPIVWNVMLIIG